MGELRLAVLGPLTIESGGKALSDLSALKAQALLVYLGVTARAQERQTLAGLLWSDTEEHLARSSLRKALAQLRRAVGDHVLADRNRIWFDCARPHWLDAHLFEEACLRVQRGVSDDPAARKSLREAVYLYRDEFLSGLRETDAALFEEWVLNQREYYRRLALDALHALARHSLASCALDDGIHDARRLLLLDPLHEDAHRTLMELHATAGNTAEALRQYDRCVHILDTELDIPPGDETMALANTLKKGRWISGVDTAEAHPAPKEPDAAVPNNLPVALTPLVGRAAELEALDRLLASEGVRLVSIVGPGGMGKTRLALATAHRQLTAHGFAHGVHYAELAPLDEPGQLANTLGEAIRLSLQMGFGDSRSAREQVLAYVQAREMLLVLDNFEHLLEGVELVGEILQTAPGVKVLVTSRERLRLPGEQVFPILGLDFGGLERADPANASAAVQLFVQNAQRAAPDFDLSQENYAQAVELCRLLEGMPLAIELAAGWVDLLSVDEIVTELRSSLDILASDRRSAPIRHRSIHAVFDATWQRLNQTEQTLFSALAVFRGGFTRTAAEQVAGASLRQLSDLAAKSLIQLDRPRHRYTLHEMVRQYAADKLAADPAWEANVRRRHSVRYCRLAQSLGADLRGARQMEAIAELEPKAENLRVAWQWTIDHRDWQLVEQAMDGLCFFYEWLGRLEEGEAAAGLAADALHAPASPDESVLRGKALTWRSVFAFAQGKTEQAAELLTEALALLETTAKDEALLGSRAFAWHQVGIQAFSRDDERARDGFAHSLALYQQAANKWGIARSLSGLAQAAADDGNYAQAQARFRETLDLLRETGDRRGQAHCLHRLAIVLRNAGNMEESVVLARESYRLYSETGDRAGMAWSSQILAECLNFAGFSEEALELLRTAEALANDLGDFARLANICQEQAILLSQMGQIQEAYVAGEKGLALARRINLQIRIAWCQIVLASLDLDAGAYEVAASRLQESERLLETSAREHEMAAIYAFQARVSLAQGERSRAHQLTISSLQLSSQHRDFRVFLGLQALVLLLVESRQLEEAVTAFAQLRKSSAAGSARTRSLIQQQITSIMEQLPPQVVDDLLAQAQQSDAWEFAARWATEHAAN